MSKDKQKKKAKITVNDFSQLKVLVDNGLISKTKDKEQSKEKSS